ncbi:MAG TPA: hypothetical protein VKU02_10700 [Gemmataceae bacterium]|nr:hypothetical protein [Gemmataceae bacterium]
MAHIRDVRSRGAGARRALLVEPPGQAGEAFDLQKDRNGSGAEGVSVVAQALADVVDGEVLFAQGDDPSAEPVPGSTPDLLGPTLGRMQKSGELA